MASTVLSKHIQGDGDLVRALTKVGYRFTYQQAPADELQFAIGMLAVDLRDGIRLNKLIELLAGEEIDCGICTNAQQQRVQMSCGALGFLAHKLTLAMEILGGDTAIVQAKGHSRRASSSHATTSVGCSCRILPLSLTSCGLCKRAFRYL